MRNLFLLLFSLTILVNAQIQFDPLYNLSNTPGATSDYHSVFSNGLFFYAAWGDNGSVLLNKSTDHGLSWGPNRTVTPKVHIPLLLRGG